MDTAQPRDPRLTPATLDAALHQALAAGLERIDARMLLLHAVGRAEHDTAYLLAHGDTPLAPDAGAHFCTLCARRLAGEPVAYLTGCKAFYGLDLRVDARVLDPRPDTETLVDWALERIPADAPWRVVDLGTGSGAIALAIAHERPRCEVWATDASAGALAVARANAKRLALPIQFRKGDWLAPLARERFDLIVSNPPYIAAGDAHLAALASEPHSALVAGADGLRDLRQICARAPEHLHAGGWLLLEHGWDQAPVVRALLHRAGFAQVQSRRDLAGIRRCSGAPLPRA